MERKTLPLIVTALMAAALISVGCKTTEPGVTQGITGAINGQIAADTESVAAAAEEALEAMSMTEVSKTATSVDGEVTARSAKRKIKIDIEKAGDNVSDVTIKVGMFGDEALALQILNAIKSNLGG